MKFQKLNDIVKFLNNYSKRKFRFFLFRSFVLSICDLVIIYILCNSLSNNSESVFSNDISFLNLKIYGDYILIIIVTAAISLRIFIQRLNYSFYSGFASWLSVQYYNCSIKTSHSKFLSISPDEYVSRLRFETIYSVDNTFFPFFELFIAFFSLLNVTIFALIFVGIKYLYLIFLSAIVFFGYVSLTRGKSKNLSKIVNISSQNSSRIITNIVSSPRTYFLTQYSFLADEDYKNSEKKLWNSKTDARFISLLPKSIFEFLVAILCLIFLSNSGDKLFNDAKIIIIVIAFIRTFPFIVIMLSNLNLISSSLSVSEKIILNLNKYFKNEIIKSKTINYQSYNKKKLIELDNISFTYETNDEKNIIFKDFSYVFQRNKSYFIKGKSGSGKSTLFDIIADLQEPTRGNINLFNNKNGIKDNPISIEYISQSFVLPTITIREFFKLGKQSYLSEKDIYQSLKIVELDKIVLNLKNQLDTILVHNAFKLSGGQKQRLLIANLFLSQPDLIIIDEGLTGVHQDLSTQILKQIRMKTKSTLLVTSHDSSIIPKEYFETIDLENI